MKPIFCLPMLLFFLLAACAPRRAEEKSLRLFIDGHVGLMEPKLKALNLASWNANATGEKKAYDENARLELEVRKVYSNKEEFERLKSWKESGKITDALLARQLTVLVNSFLPNQIDTALTRQMVEKSSRIAEVFNTFRSRVNGQPVSDNDISLILRTETDSGKRRLAWESSKHVGEIVAPMVVELVRLRNQAARQLGFENYYVMSLAAAEQSEGEIIGVFDELKRLTDGPFRKLKTQIDAGLAKKWNVAPDRMRPWHYQDRFFQEAPSMGEIDLDRFYKGKKIEELAGAFYRGIDLPADDIIRNSDLVGRPGKYQHAFCSDIDRLGDVRMMMSIKDNDYWMSTMLHELGHGVYAKNIDRGLPFLLRDAAHAFMTEAVAQLMERQASNADWLQAMVGIGEGDKEAVRAVVNENLRMRELIFSRWAQVMVRFERDMYRNPDQDLNRLWWDLVEENQFVGRPEGRNKPDWAAKIHLAQYPVYYHNYMLGELAASQILHAIVRNTLNRSEFSEVSFAGRREIGRFLKNDVFKPGMSLHWNVLMEKATGEPLTAKYFVEEFTKE